MIIKAGGFPPTQTVDKPLDYIKMGSQGRSPRTGRQPFVPQHRAVAQMADCKHPCLVWGSSPSNIAPFRGKGVFGKDAEIRTHQDLSMDAYKWSNKVGAGRTDNKRPLLHRGKAIRVS